MMTFDQFKKNLSEKTPPAELSVYLKALWFDAHNDWEKAHHLIQDLPDTTASWIHAYLHRKEGDTGNADYWYHRAGKKRPQTSLDEEWEEIVKQLLDVSY